MFFITSPLTCAISVWHYNSLSVNSIPEFLTSVWITCCDSWHSDIMNFGISSRHTYIIYIVKHICSTNDINYCPMTNYELLHWLVEIQSYDVYHYRMINVSRSTSADFRHLLLCVYTTEPAWKKRCETCSILLRFPAFPSPPLAVPPPSCASLLVPVNRHYFQCQ